MKFAYLVPAVAMLLAASTGTFAQSSRSIWRCGNTYTNDAGEARAKNCKAVEGGNVTVVEGLKPGGGSAGVKMASTAPSPSPAVSTPRIDNSEQKARDSDARAILESELKKAEARQQELLKEYNNGEPEKMGPEHRNHQKYLDRVAELKASIARNESDIAGIKRELGRASGGAPAAK